MYVLSNLLHDVIELCRLTLMLLPQDNTVSRPSISSQSAVISNVYPENFYHIYNTTFVNNNYKMPRVQVSLASLAV
jgi:hypothetical protein